MVCRSIQEFNIGHLRLKYADWSWRGSAQNVSPIARDFIERIGNEFPDKRLTVRDALEHSFITRKVSLSPSSKLITQFDQDPKIDNQNSTLLKPVSAFELNEGVHEPMSPKKSETLADIVNPNNGESPESLTLSTSKKKAQASQSKTTKCDNTIDEEEDEEEDIFSSPKRGLIQMIKFLV